MSSPYRILAGIAADAFSCSEQLALTIDSGKIADIQAIDADIRPERRDLDYRDLILTPGFIDIHIHGGAGEYVMEGTARGLSKIASHLASHGVTGFLSTTVTGAWNQQTQAVAVAANAMRTDPAAWEGAAVLGVHLEGPYINPAKKGAQPPEYVLPPSIEDLNKGVGENINAVRVVTLAPEMPGALELIGYLSSRGIIASIGHSDATYNQISEAIEHGAKHVTHCFNAMRQMEGREPGVVGSAFVRDELKAELIWDNIHVHPESCVALIKAKTCRGVILISDGIPGAGMGEGYEFHLGEHRVVVQNGAARLASGTLAGSLLTLDRAFLNAARFALSERAAMSSYNAAASLGLDHCKGLLKVGYDADLTLLGKDGSVKRTIVGGRSAFEA